MFQEILGCSKKFKEIDFVSIYIDLNWFCIGLCTFMYLYVPICIYMYLYVSICIYICIYIYIYICIYIILYIHIHIYIWRCLCCIRQTDLYKTMWCLGLSLYIYIYIYICIWQRPIISWQGKHDEVYHLGISVKQYAYHLYIYVSQV